MAPTEPLMPAELALQQHTQGDDAAGSRRQSQSGLGSVPLLAHGVSRSSSLSAGKGTLRDRLGLQGVARRTLGIILLLFTVLMWTLSNFLASVSVPADWRLTCCKTNSLTVYICKRFLQQTILSGLRQHLHLRGLAHSHGNTIYHADGDTHSKK